jgi:hypothetical protein
LAGAKRHSCEVLTEQISTAQSQVEKVSGDELRPSENGAAEILVEETSDAKA